MRILLVSPGFPPDRTGGIPSQVGYDGNVDGSPKTLNYSMLGRAGGLELEHLQVFPSLRLEDLARSLKNAQVRYLNPSGTTYMSNLG